MRFLRVLCLWLPVLIAYRDVRAQAVVSAHSGIVNFSEGSVFLDDQALNQQFGTFPAIREGGTLRTGQGRAEVLLTPGVFLRIDHNSSVRLVSNALSGTRVEFLQGAAILDSNDAAPGNSVLLTYKSFQLRFPKPGVYRLDSEPGVFETYTGEAQITAEGQAPQTIDESHQFFFGIGMETRKYGDGAVDNFSEWARNRAETIAADNRAADQSTADQNMADPGPALPSPFDRTVPNPAPAVPSYGTFGAPVFVDNGPMGYYNPFFGSPLYNPLSVIYVFPRWYGRNPWRPTPLRPTPFRPTPLRPLPWRPVAPHRTGYPTFTSIRNRYPGLVTPRPTTVPLRPRLITTPVPSRAIAPPARRMVSPTMMRPMPMGPARR
jgi:hypothetical protein